MRGERKLGSCRGAGGALNRRLAPGLGHALLQYYVDNICRLMSRADTHIMMGKAREMRELLLAEGFPEKELPDLRGNNGAQWFKRWRHFYNIH